MNTRMRFGTMAAALILAVMASATTNAEREIPLDRETMSMTFGSGLANCCGVIPACQGNNT